MPETDDAEMPQTVGMFPPKYTFEQYNEDLDEWWPRGVDDPHEKDYATVFYTCRFCPGEGPEPDEVAHSRICPTQRED